MGLSDGDRCDEKTYRWARVATSLATVWARVEYGLTWKTGKESLPSFIPRFERMTEMKWMQVFSRSGAELDLVRSCYDKSGMSAGNIG